MIIGGWQARQPRRIEAGVDAMAGGSTLLLAIGLVLIIEGLLPLVSPGGWRDAMRRISAFRDGQIRFVGLGSVVLGLLLVLVAA